MTNDYGASRVSIYTDTNVAVYKYGGNRRLAQWSSASLKSNRPRFNPRNGRFQEPLCIRHCGSRGPGSRHVVDFPFAKKGPKKYMYPIVREEMWAAVSRATGARPSLCGSMSSNVETLEIGSKIYIYLNVEKENVRSRRSITSVLCMRTCPQRRDA